MYRMRRLHMHERIIKYSKRSEYPHFEILKKIKKKNKGFFFLFDGEMTLWAFIV